MSTMPAPFAQCTCYSQQNHGQNVCSPSPIVMKDLQLTDHPLALALDRAASLRPAGRPGRPPALVSFRFRPRQRPRRRRRRRHAFPPTRVDTVSAHVSRPHPPPTPPRLEVERHAPRGSWSGREAGSRVGRSRGPGEAASVALSLAGWPRGRLCGSSCSRARRGRGGEGGCGRGDVEGVESVVPASRRDDVTCVGQRPRGRCRTAVCVRPKCAIIPVPVPRAQAARVGRRRRRWRRRRNPGSPECRVACYAPTHCFARRHLPFLVPRSSFTNPAHARQWQNSPRLVSVSSQTSVILDRCGGLGVFIGLKLLLASKYLCLRPKSNFQKSPSLSYAPSLRRDGVGMSDVSSFSQSKRTVPEQADCPSIRPSMTRRRYREFPSSRPTSVSGSTGISPAG